MRGGSIAKLRLNPARNLEDIVSGLESGTPMQGPRYTTYEKLMSGKTVKDLL